MFLGYTSGAAVQGIKQFAALGEFTEDSNIVVILPDHGSRYMSKVFSDDWMMEQGFSDSNHELEDIKVQFVK